MSAHRIHERSHEYAAVWRAGDGSSSSGKLEVGADDLVLHGSGEDELRIPFDDLSSVEIGRAADERINGDKSLVLERHHVFVSEREVVFFFEGESASAAVDALSRSPRVLKAAMRWRGILAGRPRLAAEQFGWTRAS